MTLPTNRSTSDSAADHVADHNTLHDRHNTLLVVDGFAKSIANVTTLFSVANTTTETTLATLTIPGGRAAAGHVYQFTAAGDTLNNTAAAANFTWSFKLGGTLLLATPAVSLAQVATRRTWFVDVEMVIESSSVQRLSGVWATGNASGDGTMGNIQSVNNSGRGYADGAIDLSTSQDITLTITHGTADANIDTRLRMANLTEIRSL